MSRLAEYICNNHDNITIQSRTGDSPASVEISTGNKKICIGSAVEYAQWKIWEQLYASRRLEIETQWQRTIFLSAFIVLLLSGSGGFYYYFILAKNSGCCNAACCLTSLLLGALLMISGILWLAMTKGSKYWTEVYEKKIGRLEEELSIKRQYCYVEEFDAKKSTGECELLVKTSCFNPLKPDHTSPSSVNCFIGVIILLIGAFMIFLPVFACFFKPATTQYAMNFNQIACASIIVFIVLVFLCIFVYGLLKHKCKSANGAAENNNQ